MTCWKFIAKTNLVNKSILTDDQISKLITFLENLNNRRVYASAIQRLLSLTKVETYNLIEILLENCILLRRYQIKLRDNYFPGEYVNFYEIPSSIYDEDKDEDIEISIEKHIFVFYKVNTYE